MNAFAFVLVDFDLIYVKGFSSVIDRDCIASNLRRVVIGFSGGKPALFVAETDAGQEMDKRDWATHRSTDRRVVGPFNTVWPLSDSNFCCIFLG
ncbi:hypothetical protein [Tautonia plasticadhaerens]|uniref:hypothetical protein n=1 Tax=Tautonia plasticadhaerens TaxID=2527974 RepID=UPI0018D23CEC|nr:hypothetical protein [Tautonia plasticadhaerens]